MDTPVSTKTILPLLLLLLTAYALSACSLTGVAASASPVDSDVAAGSQIGSPGSNIDGPAGMEADSFANCIGTLYVASSEPQADRWQSAGWSISDQSIDTDTTETPLDCTLYRHDGVSGQWVGGCAGSVRVPKHGAEHIAVMLTRPDGSTEMIQVAPSPTGP